MSHLRFFISILLIALFLAGCSGSAMPQLIASYPSQNQAESTHPQYIPPSQYVYDSYIELEVSNPDRIAGRAEDLTYDHGGYLVSSQSWRTDGKKTLTLVLAVPVANFESLHDSLLQLGSVVSEHVSGEWVSTGYGSNEWNIYSQITLQLRPKVVSWPDISLGGWHPLDTLENALGVSLTIFGFLINILIWVVVVMGPFVLIVWGGRWLYRRLRR
jgi:hypothetical protein